ncbi:hypothetical protein [Actinomadura harenae]|uniref:DUF4190 domain-containing protein n=1 Tax=Actinomadura harenae TaxID=2483351 RepID=A0A3M2MD15_9ACTN|nr:hypothetical protein [Actinomadura harenae]RMI47401.1 hypothetical protein EBO15_02495 [Actinomadura harenae]
MTMPGYRTQTPPSTPERQGLATASLVLGLAGLPALLLCGIGLPAALVGLALGVVALWRGRPRGAARGRPAGGARGTAVAGVVCSLVTLAIGTVAIFWLLSKAVECADSHRFPDEFTRRECIDRTFPFARESHAP